MFKSLLKVVLGAFFKQSFNQLRLRFNADNIIIVIYHKNLTYKIKGGEVFNMSFY